jgi:hypothetical protein
MLWKFPEKGGLHAPAELAGCWNAMQDSHRLGGPIPNVDALVFVLAVNVLK